jgi:hypothetical protein
MLAERGQTEEELIAQILRRCPRPHEPPGPDTA